jgi:hypothetical protein
MLIPSMASNSSIIVEDRIVREKWCYVWAKEDRAKGSTSRNLLHITVPLRDSHKALI